MPNLTSRFELNKPLVNNATDADLWGGQLNTNMDEIDSALAPVIDAKSATFTAGTDEYNYTYLVDASSGAVTANLPAVADVFSGFKYSFKLTDATNALTIDPNGSEQIDGASTYVISTVNDAVIIVCDGTGWVIEATSATVVDASTSQKGIIEIATNAEAIAGTDTDRAIVPSSLQAKLDDDAANLTAGAVGTYAYALNTVSEAKNFGDTVAGSQLVPCSSNGVQTGSALSGTWVCMGTTASGTAAARTTLWYRQS